MLSSMVNREAGDRLHGKEKRLFKVETTIILIYVMVAIAGLVTGSFLNVCISRIPEDESIITPSSHCPKCKTRLKNHDLIPVISYIMLRGRCRYCGEKISIRYPIVELLTAFVFSFIYFNSGLSAHSFIYALFASLVIIVSFVDIERMLVPDVVVLFGIGTILIYSCYTGDIIKSLYGICFGFLFMWVMGAGAKLAFRKDALGDGDIKFVVMLGAFMGAERTFAAIAIASMIGAVTGIILILSGRLNKEDYIPFIPFLALGASLSSFLRCVI